MLKLTKLPPPSGLEVYHYLKTFNFHICDIAKLSQIMNYQFHSSQKTTPDHYKSPFMYWLNRRYSIFDRSVIRLWNKSFFSKCKEFWNSFLFSHFCSVIWHAMVSHSHWHRNPSMSRLPVLTRAHWSWTNGRGNSLQASSTTVMFGGGWVRGSSSC